MRSGGALIAALRSRTGGELRVAGIGGEAMRGEGLESLVPLADLAVMGVAEVLPRAPVILRRVRETVAAIRAMQPDAVVTIDSSGFSWRIAQRLRRRGETLPLIHYVAPMVWAWRAGRARRMARWYDHLLTLLPFEPPYFERVGLACSYVGHPVLESGADRGDGARFRAAHGLADDELLLSVLPGSRGGEVRRLLPIFGAALAVGAADDRPVSGRRADRCECRRGRGRRGAKLAGTSRSWCSGPRTNTTPLPRAARRSPLRARWRSNWRWRGCRWSSAIGSTR